MFLFIVIEEKKPLLFILDQPPNEFTIEQNIFYKINDWRGGFYSLFTIKIEEVFFLAGIDYNFSSKIVELIDQIKNVRYLDIFEYEKPDCSASIYCRIVEDSDKIEEELEFSQIWGDNFLYKSSKSLMYCFCFEIPDNIRILPPLAQE